jgi:hypothetical protein
MSLLRSSPRMPSGFYKYSAPAELFQTHARYSIPSSSASCRFFLKALNLLTSAATKADL